MKKIALPLLLIITSCQSEKPDLKGLINGKLSDCSTVKNCISSQENKDTSNYVEPIQMPENLSDAKKKMIKILKSRDIKVEKLSPNYIYAESKSSILSLIDDLEFHFDAKDKQIYVKFLRRSDIKDFGSNKKLVEDIRFQYHQSR